MVWTRPWSSACWPSSGGTTASGRPSTTTGGSAAVPTRSTLRPKPAGSPTCESSRRRWKRSGRGVTCLELAAGTGVWTQQLFRFTDRVTAVDAVAEVLELNRARTGGAGEYVLADVFEWQPPRAFDVCFFSFWHSHVPSQLFDAFWQLVGRALKPEGRVFLVDNARLGLARYRVSSAGEVARRRLSDGREFDLVERLWKPAELEREVAAVGLALTVCTTANGYFISASGTKTR